MLWSVTDVYIDGIYIIKYNINLPALYPLAKAEKSYGIELQTDLFFNPTKKYANIETAVKMIANDPKVATLDKAVNLLSNVSGKSITKLIINFITNLYFFTSHSGLKYKMKSEIAFDPIEI